MPHPPLEVGDNIYLSPSASVIWTAFQRVGNSVSQASPVAGAGFGGPLHADGGVEPVQRHHQRQWLARGPEAVERRDGARCEPHFRPRCWQAQGALG